jgi:hypothetical protein
MISTTSSHAILVAIGLFPVQSAILESYESHWDNLPKDMTSIWEFVIEVDNDRVSLWELFSDLPSSPGFWVWEGSLTLDADNEPTSARFSGVWRRATLDEVTAWDESTRSIFDRLTNEYG